MISSMTSSRIARSPRAPVPRFIASRAIAATASSVNLSRTFSRSKYFWYCLMIAFFGSREDAHQRRLVQVVQGGDHRQPADELGDEPVLQQVLGLDHGQQVADPALLAALDLGAEAHAASAPRGSR